MTPTKTSSSDLYADIRRKIISLEFEPGQYLDEKALGALYGVSRTPIREVLIRLAGESLVNFERNRGAAVAPLDIGTLQSFFEAAEFVTRAIVRLTSRRRSEIDLHGIKSAMLSFESAIKQSDVARMIADNDRFHDLIGRASHNKYLYKCYRGILADNERIAKICYTHEIEVNDVAAKDEILTQHRGLFEAILERDAAAAEAISLKHLDRCKRGISQVLARHNSTLDGIVIEGAAPWVPPTEDPTSVASRADVPKSART